MDTLTYSAMFKETADLEKRYIHKVWCGGVPDCLQYYIRGVSLGTKNFLLGNKWTAPKYTVKNIHIRYNRANQLN